MKSLILFSALALSPAFAQASTLNCSTDVGGINPFGPFTQISITSSKGVTTASQTTHGGLAQFITAPTIIRVRAQSEGPEAVIYSNPSKGFELTVNFQPVGGRIWGNLITDVFGQRINSPVVCGLEN